MEVTRGDIMRLIREERERWLKEEHCPHCKGETTFIRNEYDPDEGECEEGWRCLHCMNIFRQAMVPTEPEIK